MSKKRTTFHNGRTNKNGKVYSVKHSDRNFDLSTSDHIDKNLISDNYYMFLQKMGDVTTFEEQELKFYEKHFSDFLSEKNAKALKNYDYKRVMTVEQYKTSKNTAPEETIIQLGTVKDKDEVSKQVMKEAIEEFIEWHNKQFPNAVLLNAAIHSDEPNAATHCHLRKVWLGHKDGKEVVNQTKALEEMGIERPNPNKPVGRYNNAKITYSNMCREKVQEIFMNKGFEVELQPQQASKSGLDLMDFKMRSKQEELQRLENELQAKAETLDFYINQILGKIKDERKFPFIKTENKVMNKDDYDFLINTADILSKRNDDITHRNITTQLKEAEIKKKSQEIDVSYIGFQKRVDEEIQKRCDENLAAAKLKKHQADEFMKQLQEKSKQIDDEKRLLELKNKQADELLKKLQAKNNQIDNYAKEVYNKVVEKVKEPVQEQQFKRFLERTDKPFLTVYTKKVNEFKLNNVMTSINATNEKIKTKGYDDYSL